MKKLFVVLFLVLALPALAAEPAEETAESKDEGGKRFAPLKPGGYSPEDAVAYFRANPKLSELMAAVINYLYPQDYPLMDENKFLEFVRKLKVHWPEEFTGGKVEAYNSYRAGLRDFLSLERMNTWRDREVSILTDEETGIPLLKADCLNPLASADRLGDIKPAAPKTEPPKPFSLPPAPAPVVQVKEGKPGLAGERGPQGLQGPEGPKGDPGLAGRTILNGRGAPRDDLGHYGDFYLDRDSSKLYGPKTEGVNWMPEGSPVSLKGDKGDKGDSGDPAARRKFRFVFRLDCFNSDGTLAFSKKAENDEEFSFLVRQCLAG